MKRSTFLKTMLGALLVPTVALKTSEGRTLPESPDRLTRADFPVPSEMWERQGQALLTPLGHVWVYVTPRHTWELRSRQGDVTTWYERMEGWHLTMRGDEVVACNFRGVVL